MDPQSRAARLSLLAGTLLLAVKLGVGMLTGSVGVLSEAVHSGVDVLAAGIAFLALRIAQRPADYQHPYGHGKAENLSAFAEALFIWLAAIAIIYDSLAHLVSGSRMDHLGAGLAVMGGAAVINLALSRYLRAVANRTGSVALGASATHVAVDVMTSAGVFLSLVLVQLTGWHAFDPICGLVVAVLLARTAWQLTRRAIASLMDTRLSDAEEQEIRQIIDSHKHEFIEFHDLRSRRSGRERHVDFHLVVHRSEPLAEVHSLCDRLERDIDQRFSGVMVLIHPEPCDRRCLQCQLPRQSASSSFGPV